VPLVVAGPGIHRRGHRRALSSVVDLYPTIAELAGVDELAGAASPLHGVSLVPTFASDEVSVRDHVFFAYDSSVGLAGRLRRQYRRGLVGAPVIDGPAGDRRRGLWKLHRTTDPRGTNVEQLFDLERDPGELRPLDPALHPEVLHWLRERSLRYELDPARWNSPTKT
jgi:arylsulfatase A-like enzyme